MGRAYVAGRWVMVSGLSIPVGARLAREDR